MKIKRITEYGQPTTPGTYWIILEMGNDEEKDAAVWDGEVWRYTENAADYLWGEEYGMPVLAWICEQNVIAMATLLARANVERGINVKVTWKHGEQRG